MAASVELKLPSAGGAIPLGDKALTIGRAPSNDLVLADDTVSWHHAQVWVEGGTAWVRDLASRNGTWRNGDRVSGSARLAAGDRLRLGVSYEVEVVGGAAAVGGEPPLRHVEDLSAGVRLLVHAERFLVGSGAECDLRVEGLPRAATILFHANGEIWVGTAQEERQVDVGEVFQVAGHDLRVVEEAGLPAPTVDRSGEPYDYVLRADANAAGGPAVVVSDPREGHECVVTGNRGVLLFVLARKLARDRESGARPAEAGWCSSDEAITGVWGRDPRAGKRLAVLVHRLRGQLEEHGFDPWFVEKRRGGIRVRCASVEVR